MKPSKILTLCLLLLLAALNVFAQPAAAGGGGTEEEPGRLWRAVESGDTETAFWSLVDLYRRNGAEIADAGPWKLKLKLQDYRKVINSYDNGSVSIELSRMTTSEAEAAEYWENWSRVLAKGAFDHKKFFRNDRERLLMANYNALVLAAHEIGHYLDYRYKMSDRYISGGILRDFSPLNCSEGYADKFAVAVVNQLAAEDARFREMRPRYLELIKYFNSVIPEENRYNLVSYSAVGMDKCGEVDLLKNGLNADNTVNETFFRQYASAYFNRHRLMLENAAYPSSLGEVIERDLLQPFFSRINYSNRKVAVRTLGEYPGEISNQFYFGGDEFRETFEFYANLPTDDKKAETKVPRKLRSTILNDKGEVRHLEIGWTAGKILHEMDGMIFKENEFSLNLLDPGKKITDSFKIRVPRNLKNNFVFSKIVLPTDDEIIVVLTPFDMKRKYDHVVVLHLRRTAAGAGWGQPRVLKFSTPGLTDADEIAENWFVTPAGKLNLLRKQTIENSDAVTLTVYEIDRSNFTAQLKRSPFAVRMKTNSDNQSLKKGLWRLYKWSHGAFGNEAGAVFLPGSDPSLQFPHHDANLFEIAQSEARAILGNIEGIRDGDDPRRIQISGFGAPRFISENRIVFLDNFNGKTYLRELVLR